VCVCVCVCVCVSNREWERVNKKERGGEREIFFCLRLCSYVCGRDGVIWQGRASDGEHCRHASLTCTQLAGCPTRGHASHWVHSRSQHASLAPRPPRRSGRSSLAPAPFKLAGAASLGDPPAPKLAASASARQSGVWGARQPLAGATAAVAAAAGAPLVSARSTARGGGRWK
jgi:hypothetical protein